MNEQPIAGAMAARNLPGPRESSGSLPAGATGISRARALALGLWLAGGLGCGEPPSGPDVEIKIGLLLSYSGYLAAHSFNSERAVLMAIEAASQDAAALGGRRLRVVARDTRSDASKVVFSAGELVSAGTAVVIGPDTIDLVTALRALLGNRTIILPSYATSSDVGFKPPSWFVMGAATKRVACEMAAQLRSDGRERPLLIVNPTGYNSYLSWVLINGYGMPRHTLSTNHAPTTADVAAIAAANADAYVLAAFPASASALVLALSSLEALGDSRRWYLSPTLHTPAFLQSIPKGILTGARGVSAGAVAGAAEFRARFEERWQDTPLDDAYPFYDAAAVTVLALARALALESDVPAGTGLSPHVVAVTQPGRELIMWNELSRGLDLLRQGQEVTYVGLSGALEFDLSGQAKSVATRWWTIEADQFADVPSQSDCR